MKKEKDKQLLNELEAIDTGCDFKLENFEGPIELLWHMIKDTKLEIADVKLADLTEQYLTYMEGLENLDLEKGSDFIDVAATLIEIKSKSLLPNDDDDDEDFEFDSEALLKQRIKEYDLFQQATQNLRPLENVDRFYKPADDTVNDFRFVLGEMNMNALLDAFAKVLTRVRKKEEEIIPRKIEKDRFTVADKIVSIRENLSLKKRVRFSELFQEDYTKSEMINLFLAVLELLKMQEICVKQQTTYDDIDIELKEVLEETNAG